MNLSHLTPTPGLIPVSCQKLIFQVNPPYSSIPCKIYHIYFDNRSRKLPRRFFLEIFVNGAPYQLQSPCSVQQLLEKMDMIGQRLAVEVNEEIVPKSRHPEHTFNEGDKVEIVNAIGGG
ncbi:MAG: sulfur carrier protein ThiS [Bacteroidota bacterium]